MNEKNFTATILSGVQDTHGKQVSLSLDAAINLFSTRRESNNPKTKNDTPHITSWVFDGRRSRANAKYTELLILDIDDGMLQDALVAFTGYTYCYYSTYNAMVGDEQKGLTKEQLDSYQQTHRDKITRDDFPERYRFILFLKEQLTPDEMMRCKKSFIEFFSCDPSCFNITQPQCLPLVRPGAFFSSGHALGDYFDLKSFIVEEVPDENKPIILTGDVGEVNVEWLSDVLSYFGGMAHNYNSEDRFVICAALLSLGVDDAVVEGVCAQLKSNPRHTTKEIMNQARNKRGGFTQEAAIKLLAGYSRCFYDFVENQSAEGKRKEMIAREKKAILLASGQKLGGLTNTLTFDQPMNYILDSSTNTGKNYFFARCLDRPRILVTTNVMIVKQMERLYGIAGWYGNKKFPTGRDVIAATYDKFMSLGILFDSAIFKKGYYDLFVDEADALIVDYNYRHRAIRAVAENRGYFNAAVYMSGTFNNNILNTLNIDHEYIIRRQQPPGQLNMVKVEDKYTYLVSLVEKKTELVMVYLNEKVKMDKLGEELTNQGIKTQVCHADNQTNTENVELIENNRIDSSVRVLITNKVAMRGINIENIVSDVIILDKLGSDLCVQFANRARNNQPIIHLVKTMTQKTTTTPMYTEQKIKFTIYELETRASLLQSQYATDLLWLDTEKEKKIALEERKKEATRIASLTIIPNAIVYNITLNKFELDNLAIAHRLNELDMDHEYYSEQAFLDRMKYKYGYNITHSEHKGKSNQHMLKGVYSASKLSRENALQYIENSILDPMYGIDLTDAKVIREKGLIKKLCKKTNTLWGYYDWPEIKRILGDHVNGDVKALKYALEKQDPNSEIYFLMDEIMFDKTYSVTEIKKIHEKWVNKNNIKHPKSVKLLTWIKQVFEVTAERRRIGTGKVNPKVMMFDITGYRYYPR